MTAIRLPMSACRFASGDRAWLLSASTSNNSPCLRPAPINCRLIGFKKEASGFGGMRMIGKWGICGYGETGGKFLCGCHSASVGASKESDGDGDYLNSTVLDAAEVKNGSGHLIIKLRDGKYMKCVHNRPTSNFVPDFVPHPAIVLKIEDGSGLLLPIIVLEMQSALLMAALNNIEMARPTVYNIMKDMVEAAGYMVKLVRVSKRVHEAYFAELCIAKVGEEADTLCFDIRPSDAVNIAVRCKAPILVSKDLARTDGLKIVEVSSHPVRHLYSSGTSSLDMDRPDGEPCPDSEEFMLVRNMFTAALEERYDEAGLNNERNTLSSDNYKSCTRAQHTRIIVKDIQIALGTS